MTILQNIQIQMAVEDNHGMNTEVKKQPEKNEMSFELFEALAKRVGEK